VPITGRSTFADETFTKFMLDALHSASDKMTDKTLKALMPECNCASALEMTRGG
jgi:hypothetical protein